jgi:hypothetical protein
MRIPLSASDVVPSPRGNAGRGSGRGVRLVGPPLPRPLLHKYAEEREWSEAAQKERCALKFCAEYFSVAFARVMNYDLAVL